MVKKVKLLAVAWEIMTKNQPKEKTKTVPKSPKVYLYSHHFLFFKIPQFSPFFFEIFFASEFPKYRKEAQNRMRPGLGKTLSIATKLQKGKKFQK
jgi:hypothetical protein